MSDSKSQRLWLGEKEEKRGKKQVETIPGFIGIRREGNVIAS